MNQRHAMELLHTTSASWLRDLVYAGSIKAAYWDERTLMYHKRSIEQYLTTKRTLHATDYE